MTVIQFWSLFALLACIGWAACTELGRIYDVLWLIKVQADKANDIARERRGS